MQFVPRLSTYLFFIIICYHESMKKRKNNTNVVKFTKEAVKVYAQVLKKLAYE